MSIGRIVAAAPDVALGLTMILTWIAPQLLGPGKATYAAQLMTLEFVVVHSAVIVGYLGTISRSRIVNGALIIGISALYSMLAILVGRASNSLWPLWSFWGLTLNRLFSLVGNRVARREEGGEAGNPMGGVGGAVRGLGDAHDVPADSCARHRCLDGARERQSSAGCGSSNRSACSPRVPATSSRRLIWICGRPGGCSIRRSGDGDPTTEAPASPRGPLTLPRSSNGDCPPLQGDRARHGDSPRYRQ